MMGCPPYLSIGRRRTLVVRTVSLVCAAIADFFIFFVTNALACIFNDRQAACVVIRCRLNNEVEMVLRSALSAGLGPLYNRAGGIWSKGLSSESYATVVDFINSGLDTTELGLVASISMPYIWAFFLMLLGLAEVSPANFPGTPNGGGVEVG